MNRDWIDEEEEEDDPLSDSFPNAVDAMVIGMLAALIMFSMRY